MKEIIGSINVENGNPEIVLTTDDVSVLSVHMPEFGNKFREFLVENKITEDGGIFFTYHPNKKTIAGATGFDEANHIPIITFIQSYLDGINKP